MNQGLKVIGVSEKSGEYEGQKYDNFVLHCVYEAENVRGNGVKQIKMKRAVYNQFPAQAGDVIDVMYDQYGKVKQLVTMPEWTAPVKK